MSVEAALVTGGAQRIGAAMVRRLAARGAAVAIHYNASRAAAEALAAEVSACGVAAAAIGADLLDRGATAALVPAAAAALGRPLTVLVNNASTFEHDTIRSATWESWDRHVGSNLRAPFELIQAFAAQAPRAGPRFGASASRRRTSPGSGPPRSSGAAATRRRSPPRWPSSSTARG